VAVRLDSSGSLGIVYTSCDPVAVNIVELVIVEDNWGDRSSRAWKIEFPKGSKRMSFVVGQTPDDAIERVPWHRPEQTELAARLVLDGDIGTYQVFDLAQLKPGEYFFHNRAMNPDEFQRVAACDKRPD
jgi:hypothetical protein